VRPYHDPRSGMLAREKDGSYALRPDSPPVPCIHCGTLTDRTVIGGLCEKVKQPGETPQETNQMSPGSIGYALHPTQWEVLPVCPDCERRRCIAQWKAVAANLECYPHLRAAAIAALGPSSEAGA